MQLVNQSLDVRVPFDEMIKQELPWLLLQEIVGYV